ncbi:unnamed protein product [Pieris brassicae]|uniref:DNA-directed DNA polymerase n=1 Tax=Pieris brassicae TaxID=7116 RepID=A0A9P0T8U6_PIEBR|nr:unnamed protein product [Pieris brassicae]
MMVLCDEFDGKLVDQMGRGTKRKGAVDINSADIKRIKSGSNMHLSRSSQEQSTSNEADIFENFRCVCIKTYDLDPAHYYTAPGLSWDTMLKHTKTEIELLSDIDMIAFIKSGIRGGVSQCSTRYAKANNVYMSDYNAKDKESFLMYFDANNLYGWAMSQYLPTGGFEWVSVDTHFNVSCSSDIGFILEVDLEYPWIYMINIQIYLFVQKIYQLGTLRKLD